MKLRLIQTAFAPMTVNLSIKQINVAIHIGMGKTK